jgi:hypothetical protein
MTSQVNRQPERGTARLELMQLRQQLDVLIGVSDRLRAHLEAERDQAGERGDSETASAFEQCALQVTRVRNEVWSARRDLDAISIAGTQVEKRPAA